MRSTHLGVAAVYDNVALVCRTVRLWAADELADEDLGPFESALAEAVNNVIEHSYEEAPNKRLDVKFRFVPEGVAVSIFDYGKGMDPKAFDAIPATIEFDPLDLDSLPEGGMGIGIMKSVFDETTYARRARFNRLVLKKNREMPSGST